MEKWTKEPLSKEGQDRYEAIFGWMCFYCKVSSNGEICEKCQRKKEEAKIK